MLADCAWFGFLLIQMFDSLIQHRIAERCSGVVRHGGRKRVERSHDRQDADHERSFRDVLEVPALAIHKCDTWNLCRVGTACVLMRPTVKIPGRSAFLELETGFQAPLAEISKLGRHSGTTAANVNEPVFPGETPTGTYGFAE